MEKSHLQRRAECQMMSTVFNFLSSATIHDNPSSALTALCEEVVLTEVILRFTLLLSCYRWIYVGTIVMMISIDTLQTKYFWLVNSSAVLKISWEVLRSLYCWKSSRTGWMNLSLEWNGCRWPWLGQRNGNSLWWGPFQVSVVDFYSLFSCMVQSGK